MFCFLLEVIGLVVVIIASVALFFKTIDAIHSFFKSLSYATHIPHKTCRTCAHFGRTIFNCSGEWSCMIDPTDSYEYAKTKKDDTCDRYIAVKVKDYKY